MYRHDRMPYLRRILDDAKEKGYIAGVKFVRGAYMEAERKSVPPLWAIPIRSVKTSRLPMIISMQPFVLQWIIWNISR